MKTRIRSCIILCFLLLLPLPVLAIEVSQEQEMVEEMDFYEIEQVLDDFFAEENVDFETLVMDFISGDTMDFKDFLGRCLSLAADEMGQWRNEIAAILILAISAAIFSVLSDVFDKHGIADISFLVMYLLFCMLILRSFDRMSQTACEVVLNVCEFMKALLPAYFLSITVTGASSTASVFYPFILGVIEIVVTGIQQIILPMIEVYLLLSMMNCVGKEEFITKLVELLGNGIQWLLKTFLAVVCGFQLIQGMITPMVDSFKNTTLSKTVSAIPGFGNTAGAVADMFVGSALLVKNGIGVAAMIILIFICAAPLIELGVCTFLYKVIAAFIQPVSDKRMTACVDSASKASALLLRTCTITMMMFMLSIGIIGMAVK